MSAAPQLIGSSGDSLREAFGKSLVDLAERYPDFVVLDGDVAGGTGTHHFRKHYPRRFYQCGIAEQNMVSLAAGMATVDLPVFVTTFAVFSLRAVEQVRLSVAYARRNVKIVASHPGLDVGPDGASAQCLEDLAMYRAIPGMTVISPADPLEVAAATEAMLKYDGPVYMRSGRSPAQRIFEHKPNFTIGKAQVLREGSDVTLVACGKMVAQSLEAAAHLAEKGISAEVVNAATLKPFDHATLETSVTKTGAVVSAEDHNIFGGLGGAVAESLALHRPAPLEMVGVRDTFGESGEPDELNHKYGLTPAAVAAAAKRVIARKA
ncbi:transketolase family protein [Acanthopleuribacter pedis]|uniref:Transketolase family protein n=1 Tax=Acanthopleuribacter pedis TaxID=442870 RepID=A0A8J7U1C4_9BACT|nr:transketolase C-terminal domain-containing protein [Acanthopleuribacter pedis]MBO1318033.1 transketolase family protein [Acanthopleuribacter pedis]